MKKSGRVALHRRPHCIWIMFMLLLGILFGWTGHAFAEGSRSLYPASYPTTCGTGAGQGCRADLDLEPTLAPYIGEVTSSTFLYVYAQAGEYIVLGSRNQAQANGGDIYVYNPQNFGVPGAEIYNPTTPGTPNFTCSAGPGAANFFGGTTGTIANRAQELAGPNSADNTVQVTNGFTPCAYQAPVTGSYGVLFFAATAGGANPNGNIVTPVIDNVGVSAWDVTVRANRTSITDINGRLYTYAFIGLTGGNSRPIYSSLYYVTRDGYRYRQDIKGMDGNGYALYSNSLGFLDSGQPLYKDLRGNDSQVSTPLGLGVTTQTAENPTFFSDISPSGANATEVNRVLSSLNIPLVPPSPTVTNVDFIGNVSGSTTYLGTGGTFTFDTSNTITYQIVISYDGINFDPANANNKTLTGLAPAGSHIVVWDGTNNSGANFPAGGPYPFQVSGRNGEIHFPMIDVENNYFGGPTITRLNGTGAPSTTVYYDDRGYVLSSGVVVGTLNGILCPTTTPPQPVQPYSLVAIDSSASYRTWGVLTGTSNPSADCTSTNAWGDAKAINLWTYYSYTPSNQTLSIISVTVDATANVTGPASAIAGNAVQGTFAFANNGTGTAHGLTYAMSLTPGLGTVTFGNLPAGATAAYNNSTGTVTFTGFPATLAAGTAIRGAIAGAPMTYSYTAPAFSVTVQTGITTTDTDGVPANNNDSVTTHTGTVDVLTIASVPSIVAPQSTVTGNILFANNGTNAATGVTYSATIGNSSFYPALITFTSVPSGVTPSYNSATGAITFTGLPTTLGSSQSFNIGFNYSAPSSGTIPVTSSITTTSTDINLSNNNSSTSTVIGPDLTITKSRTGNFYQGQTGATYTITVTDVGGATGGTQVTVTDTLPTGLTATAISGTGWTCTLATLTCTRSDVLAAGASYPAITLTVNVTAATGTQLRNTATVSGGGDINTGNNTGTDLVIVSAVAPNLSITKSHTGNFTQGQTGATYSLTVTNVGTATKANGNTVTVTDTLPAGLTATAISGTGWTTCTLATLTCTRTDALTAGSSYPSITLTVTVSATASSPLVNTASVTDAVATDTYTADKTATDSTVILTTLPDLTIAKTHSSNFYLGATGIAYTIMVTNNGAVSKSAGSTVTVTDTLPSGLTATAISGTGWTCTLGTLTCTRTDALAAGSSYPIITVTVNVSISAPYTLTNTAIVSLTGQGESNYNNNMAQDTTTITPTLVTIADFKAYNDNGQVVVQWETASEYNTLGFYLLRLDAETGEYTSITEGLLPGLLTDPRGGTYNLVDSGAAPGRAYQYKLIEVERNGRHIVYGPFTVSVSTKNETATNVLSNSSARSTMKTNSAHPLAYTRSAREQSVLQKGITEARKTAFSLAAMTSQPAPVTGSRIKITITEDGLYYVDAGDISAITGISYARVSKMIDRNQIAVSNQGQPVAYLPARNKTGIYFYGTGTDSVYTRNNIYWIDTTNGITMQNDDWGTHLPVSISLGETFTDNLHIEQNLIQNMVQTDDPSQDYWDWDLIYLSKDYSDGPKTFNFSLFGKADTRTKATLQTHLVGGSDSGIPQDHHVVVSLNGQQIGESWWGGLNPYTLAATFDQSLLNEGVNTIEVKGVLDRGIPWSMFFIDYFDLAYERLYDAVGNKLSFTGDGNKIVTVGGFTTINPDILLFNITDPRAPKLNNASTIEGNSGNYEISFMPVSPDARYLAIARDAAVKVDNAVGVNPSNLRSNRNMADYLIIAPGQLVSAAQPLAAYRGLQGLKTMVVSLDDILNEFNFGLSNPEAIRQFLTYAYRNWRQAPRYIVLAGGGTWDYRDNLGAGGNLIPPAMVPTSYGLCTSDNHLADVDGDHIPEMAIGRLPVLTPQELQDVTRKIITFERTVSNRVILLADRPDDGGNFASDSNAIAGLFPPVYLLEKVYLGEYPSVDTARQSLFNDISGGAVFINYIGHASPDMFSAEGLLTSEDIGSLPNRRGLPIIIAMTCTAGEFAIPGYPSMSQLMVLKSDGGAAAFWSSTGLSDNSEASILDRAFYNAVFFGNKRTLGDAVLEAFKKYRTSGTMPFLNDIYTILGDPALRLK